MPRFSVPFLVFGLTLLCAGPGFSKKSASRVKIDPSKTASSADFAHFQRLFEWGEADSLKDQLPSALENPRWSPGERAALWRYLGVAFWMEKDSARAVESFGRSLQLDPEGRLEAAFVSRPILQAFEREKARRIAPAGSSPLSASGQPPSAESAPSPLAPAPISDPSPLASASVSHPSPLSPPASSAPAPGPGLFASRPARLALLATSYALAAGLGYLALREYQETGDLHREYQDAVGQRRTDLREKVIRGDQRTLAYGAGSGALLGFGLYFHFTLPPRFPPGARPSSAYLSPQTRLSLLASERSAPASP